MTESQSPPPPDWPTCEVDDDCIGVQLDADDYACVQQTADEDARGRWWTNRREGGRLDARGLTFTSDQLQELLDGALRNQQNRPRLAAPNFDRTMFERHARFAGATFEGGAKFVGATFTRRCRICRRSSGKNDTGVLKWSPPAPVPHNHRVRGYGGGPGGDDNSFADGPGPNTAVEFDLPVEWD